jgi:G:T-mismatch repair DNA endonuclease (very short patch repair protein)
MDERAPFDRARGSRRAPAISGVLPQTCALHGPTMRLWHDKRCRSFGANGPLQSADGCATAQTAGALLKQLRVVENGLRFSCERMGWRVVIIWECEVANSLGLNMKLKEYLDS